VSQHSINNASGGKAATIVVATGHLSGVIVLDIDSKTPGPSGRDSLEELGLSSLVDAPIAHTPSGGAHYYFDSCGHAEALLLNLPQRS
jgi:hypothetical protein